MQLKSKILSFSKKDKIRKIKLPKKLTPELAEIIGVIIGDGHLIHQRKYKTTIMNKLVIAGHSKEDLDYYKNKINPLFKKLFGIKLNINHQRKNELIVSIYSKAITGFFKSIGIPTKNKNSLCKIPNIILKNNKIIKSSFIKGLADTDFSLTFKKKHKKVHYYPVIKVGLKSKNLIKQLTKLLKEFNFNFSSYLNIKEYNKQTNKVYTQSYIYISGKNNLEKWIKLIGFNNPKHITKYQIWKKLGYCPPNTNLNKRTCLLKTPI